MASLLSLNLNGRFRSGAEAHRIGQAVLQRLLRGTDILIGQQAHFQPCLPSNYRMVGSPSAFVAYNCQLYTATELGHVQCLVHSKFSELPASNWTAARVFFEQTSQEMLVVSWFTDDSIRSKKRSEALLKRLIGAATEFSSSFGLPFLIGGSFNVSMEDANAILRNAGFTGVRCYGYWLDSMRRSVRASSLFICVETDVDLVHVRPRSLSGNLCLGYRNDNWINPEDSFFWDPLSAKITITTATATMSQMFVASESLASPPKSSIKDAVATTASKLRDTQRRRRQNFDVIRTTKDYDADNYSSSVVSTLTHFALGLQQSSSQEEGEDAPRYANPALLAISQTAAAAAAKRKQTTRRQICAQSEEAYETEEFREILTRLRAGREVRIGEEEPGKRENESINKASSAEEYDFGEYFVDHSRIFLTQQDDPDRMSSGQFSRKLSTISESGESSCSSYRDSNNHYYNDDDDDNDDGSLHIELDDSEGTPGMSSVEASNDDDLTKDRIRWKYNNNSSNNNNKRGSLDGYTADESAEEKVGIACNSSSSAASSSAVRVSSSSPSSSKQSSQEERIVEGSSDVDQDDNRPSALSFAGRYICRATREEEKREEEEVKEGEEKPKKLRSKIKPEERAAVRNYENHVDAFDENCSSISEFYEETNFESNFACRLL